MTSPRPPRTTDPRVTAPSTGIVRLYVSNVSPVATEEEVRTLIEPIVPIHRLHLVRNMRHGLCARFVFLDIAGEHEPTIRKALDGARFMGRTIGVLRVLVRPDRPGPDGV